MDESGTTVTTRHAVDASPFLSSSSVIAVEHHVPTMNYDRMRRELLRFLEAAPLDWEPGTCVRKLHMFDEVISCVMWEGRYYATGTDIVRSLVWRFRLEGQVIGDRKKFEEGVFSDLRNLKPGLDATLEEPRSRFLDYLYKLNCIRTHKKQKFEKLFQDAMRREKKREIYPIVDTLLSLGVDNPRDARVADNIRSLFDARRGFPLLSMDTSGLNAGDDAAADPNQNNGGVVENGVLTSLPLLQSSSPAAPLGYPLTASPSFPFGVGAGGRFPSPLLPPLDNDASVPAGRSASPYSSLFAADAQPQPQQQQQQQQQQQFAGSLLPSLGAAAAAASSMRAGGLLSPISPTRSKAPISPSSYSAADDADTADIVDYSDGKGGVDAAVEGAAMQLRALDDGGRDDDALLDGDDDEDMDGDDMLDEMDEQADGGELSPAGAADEHEQGVSRNNSLSYLFPLFGAGGAVSQSPGVQLPGAPVSAASAQTGTRRRAPYMCPQPLCGREFKRFQHLKRHQLTHSGEKPFRCPDARCGKAFARSDNLAQHIRIHYAERSPAQQMSGAAAQQQANNAHLLLG